MKVQFDARSLRLRVAVSELESLRSGVPLDIMLDWPGAPWRLQVALAPGFELEVAGGTVRLGLPEADLAALAVRLPAREGLRFTGSLPSGPLEVRFEVDLHDGRRRPR